MTAPNFLQAIGCLKPSAYCREKLNETSIRLTNAFCLLLTGMGLIGMGAESVRAAGIVQDFYVPLPEAQIYQANNTIIAGTGSTIFSTISIHIVSDNTVVYYDQWEDGYETDLNNPTKSTTLIWGDGNDAHGIPPGMVHNPLGLPAGTIITLTNGVVTQPRNAAVFAYDGRDHIGATHPIVVTRAHWPTTTGTVIAGAVSVLSTAQWDTNYICPVGQNMTNGLMSYVGLFVQAKQFNTTVTIDPTGTNGAGVTNVVLNQGDSFLYNGGILKGAKVTASLPVQADLVVGHKNASYAVDWFNLYPVSSWGSTYYTPVGSANNGQPAYVYLYNPNSTNIAVNVNTKIGLTAITLPATNVYQYTMPASSGASFVATNGQTLYAICTVNASPSADTTWNWGFSLVPTQKLTTEVDVGWAPGSGDGSANGSPVWVTPLASTKLYVVYGDSTNSLTDPVGGKYSTNFSVSAYQSLKIYNPSKNQTGMRIYTLDTTLITAAWGEDADVAGAGNPYIDAGYTVLPFPVPSLKKSVANLTHPGQAASLNDHLQYTVTIANNNLVPLEGIVLVDLPSSRLQYLAGSTTNYTSLATNAVADKTGGGFPLSTPGYTNAIIQAQSSLIFRYTFTCTNTSGVITNLATIPSSLSGLNLASSLSANTTVSVAGSYVAPVINFTDTNGVGTNAYAVGMTNVYVTVTNAAANLVTNAADTIQVSVLDTITGDYETLTLTETGTNTGVFRNITGLLTSPTSGLYPNDNILHGSSGDPLTVTYIDATSASYSASATLTGSSGSGSGGGSGTSPALTKQLYLDSTNGTAQALNRFDPVHYAYGTTLTSTDIGNGSSGLGTVGVDTVSSNIPNALLLTNVIHGGANPFLLVGLSWAKLPGGGTGAALVTNVYVIGTNAIGAKVTNTMTLVVTNLESGSGCASIYELINPPQGTNVISITASNGAAISTLCAGAVSFTNVNQTAPLSATNKTGNVTSANASNVVSSAAGEIVFDVVTIDAVAPTALGSSQIKVYMGVGSGNKEGGGCSYQIAAGSKVTNSWTSVSDPWAGVAVSVQPAATGGGTSGPSTNATAFVQIPAFNSAFTIPSNSVFYITNFITLTNGAFTANPNVTAQLQTNGVTFLTLNNPTYNSGVGVNTNLVWTNALSADLTIPANTAITLVVADNVANSAFHINYGSSSKPSVILLPASPATVIAVSSLGVYDAPYPGGNQVSAPVAGTQLYIRAVVSDPFGNYDISSVNLSITAPGGGVASPSASLVGSTATNAVFEYAWTATSLVGNYSIAATASEGTEGITATAATTLSTTFLDLGTPSTTEFTLANNGAATNAYPTNSVVWVRVTDLNRNTNSTTVEAITVALSDNVTSDAQIMTLYETSTNTGVFTNSMPATTNTVSILNDGIMQAPAGSILTASYTDPTAPSDQSSATAVIQQPVGVASLAIFKTISSPSSGTLLLGQPVTYNIHVLNNGSTTLSSLAVTDSYPSQLAYAGGSPAPAITNASSRLLIWTNLGPFTAGQSTNLTVSFSATNASPATNSAWAGGGGAATITNSVPLVINNPGLSIFKTVLNPVATNQVGSNIVFQLVITNTGTTTILTLPLEDYFSGACFQFVSNNIVSTNVAAITGWLPSSGYGALVWTNIAPTNGLAPGGIITNNVTMMIVGQGFPANNSATVDYAMDSLGNAVPVTSSSVGVTNAAALISGYVYNDVNQSGIYSVGDSGLSGVTVQLFTTNTGVQSLVASTTTGANGAYQFPNLGTNKYFVVESVPAGFAASSSVNLTTNVTALISYTNVNFFAYLPAPATYASISGSVTNDVNWNGVANSGEPGLLNVTINLIQDLNSNELVNAGEPLVASTTTDTNGNFSFINIPPGRYVLQEAVPYGYYATNVTLGAGSAGFLVATNGSGVLTNFTQVGLVLTNAANSTGNNFVVAQYELSGTVFDDRNGLVNNLVDGTATNATGVPLFANLLNTASNVLASVTVSTNGSYLFTNLISGTYLVQLNVNAGTIGSPMPLPILPANWVGTGESINGVNDSSFDDLITVPVATVVTNANFGIDQLPASVTASASYTNPGGTSTVVVPALTGTDMEQGALGGTTNTVVIKTLPANGTLSYNGGAVTLNQAIANYNPALLTVDPAFEGSGTVTFTFAIEDAAGQMSATAAAVTLNFNGVSLSGTVYDDANGLTDGLVNGVATNAVGMPLFANLINAGGSVLASVAVATNGSYTFSSISSGSVTVQLSTNAGSVGSASPAAALPANWVNTGESANGVPDGTPNGQLSLTVATINVNNANFGIDQLPTSVATNATFMNPGGTNTVVVPALAGTDMEQGALGGATNTVVITTLPGNGTLYYNGVAVMVNQVITNYTPALLMVHPTFGRVGTMVFTFAMEDAAGQVSGTAATVTLTVTAVNIPPTFVNGADQTVSAGAGAQSVTSWATSISPGPSDEAGQTVTFHTSNNNNGLFSSPPVLTSAGTLTYTPAGNVVGSATVSVYLTDNGGTANGGNDTSGTNTFTITIIKDTPVFSGLTASSSITYGTTSITLIGKISTTGAVTLYPASGETVVVTINGNVQTTTVNDATGDFSFSYNPATIPYSATPHVITYGYGGNGYLNSTNDISRTLTVTKATLTVTPNAASSIYDGTTLNNATYSDNTANYSYAGFQNNETVSSAGATLSGSMAFNGSTATTVKDVGTYTQAAGTLALSANNYSMSFANATPHNYVITAKALTAQGTLSLPSKVYDGTTSAALAGAAALQGTESAGAGSTGDGKPYSVDSVSLTGTSSYAYNSKDVGSATTVTESGLSLTGPGNGNYTLTAPTLSVGITPKALNYTGISAASKTYDATPTATLSGTAAKLTAESAGSGSTGDGAPYTGDTVTFTTGTLTGTFVSQDVANGIAVSVTGGITLGAGGQSADYMVGVPNTAPTANINPKLLTVTGATVTPKFYDGATAATITGAALQAPETPGSGTTSDGKPYSGDTVTLGSATSGTFVNQNVGTGKSVTTAMTLSGAQVNDYSLTQPTLTGEITPNLPVASSVTYHRAKDTALKISVTNLIAVYTSQSQGDALGLVAVAGGLLTNNTVIATTTNGTVVYLANPYRGSAYIVLAPTNNLSETFAYIVNDTTYPSFTATNLITISVTNAVGQVTGNIYPSGGGGVTTTWAGQPGSAYVVQRSSDFSTWTDLWTTNAPTAGVFSFTDPSPPGSAAYYRLRQN